MEPINDRVNYSPSYDRQLEKTLADVENLKDKVRKNGNGAH